MLNYRDILEKQLGSDLYRDLKDSYRKPWDLYFEALGGFLPQTKESLRDLFYFNPDLARFQEGEYVDSSKIFVFCRKDRTYPCLMIMKDHFNLPVFLGDKKTLWHQPILGYSAHELGFNFKDGNTPSGIQ
jgi:hypothetical protein